MSLVNYWKRPLRMIALSCMDYSQHNCYYRALTRFRPVACPEFGYTDYPVSSPMTGIPARRLLL